MNFHSESPKILVMRLSSMGDIVVLSPLFRSLRERFKNSQIDFIVKKQFSSLVENNPYISNILLFDTKDGLNGWLDLCRKLSNEGYSLFIDMHNNIRSWILSLYMWRVRQLKYRKPRLKRFLLFYMLINLFPKNFSLLDEYYKVLTKLGIKPSGYTPEIFLDNGAKSRASDVLRLKRIEKPFAVFLPIAAWKNKRYPIAKFSEVAREVTEKLKLNVVWLGGKSDEYLNDPALDEKGDQVTRIIGETDLETSLSIISESKLVVGNDTGLTYSAEALGVPTVLILGPTSKETGAGLHRQGSMTLQKNFWCRPCSQRGNRRCYRKKRYCIEDITVDEIVDAVTEIIGKEE